MAKRFFVYFEITPQCMRAGLRGQHDPTGPQPDVLDNLVSKMRDHATVRQMLEALDNGNIPNVVIGLGRDEHDAQLVAQVEPL